MHIRFPAQPTFQFELAAFLAVLVVAIILIFVYRVDTAAMKAITDVAVAYCVWRGATAQRAGGDVRR
jgi:multidrug transporter EmrE-like cation transporter